MRYVDKVTILIAFMLLGCNDANAPKVLTIPPGDQSVNAIQILCSDAWYQKVEAVLTSGDGQGHGPDIGGNEWQSVVEFKLGVRGDKSVPQRSTDEWCAFIDEQLQH
ncbi:MULTISPECIES: hypothetical protein [Shewanella]|jgi:hypothetical protein|uniref:hypothetical protein n=1 Tax=Shewanella TaxID=22 RepID=UPI001CF83CFF|nr:hypothetical protein [Shewanella glacialimarina]UCX04098.1 hypothetical protein FJ709_06030 [Shewanella glacialimarina]